jgi:hypothetical protein
MADRLSNLISNTAANLLAAGVIAMGIVAWAWVREAGPVAIVYGLVTLVCLLYLFDWLGWRASSTDALIYEWLGKSGFPIEKPAVPSPEHTFLFIVREQGGQSTAVYQRPGDAFITIESMVNFHPDHRRKYESLSPRQQRQFARSVEMELAKYGISFGLRQDANYMGIRLDDIIAVTKTLDAVQFLRRVHFVRVGKQLAIKLVQGLDDIEPEAAPPVAAPSA